MAFTRATASTLVAFLLVLMSLPRTADAPGHSTADAAAMDAGASDEPTVVDTRPVDDATSWVGRTAPARPESWQKPPPCDRDGAAEVEKSGACYIRSADAKPPCPPKLYLIDGACYVAVARYKRPPTSIDGGGR